MQNLLALLLIVPATSIRLAVHSKQNEELSSIASTTPDVLCRDPQLISRACDILAQGDSNSQVSEEQIRNYFVADPSSTRAFVEEVGIPVEEESMTCHNLCTHTLKYVTDVLEWPLPYFTDRYCTLWEYKTFRNSTTVLVCKHAVLVSPEAMGVIANQNDIPDEVQEERSAEADEAFDEMMLSDGSPSTASEYLSYTVPELVERISNLFRVFPSMPNIDKSPPTSFMELDPDFHENVDSDARYLWQQINAEARGWVDAVLQHFPHSLVKAFFGAETSAEIREVRRVLAGMVKTLDNVKIKNAETHNCVGKDGLPDGTKAYVLVSRDETGQFLSSDMDGSRYVINICDFYWKPEVWSQPSSKFGTLVHESAHHHGPTDRRFRGSIPYGVAQCLRMASMANDAAMSNADNYAQFAYYVNKCWGKARSSTPVAAPCSARLVLSQGDLFMTPKCSQDVEVATVKIEDTNGETLATHLNLAKLKAGMKGSFSVPAPVGAVVKFFYEMDCIMFEGKAVFQGAAVSIQPVAVLDMSAGASDTTPQLPQPEAGHQAEAVTVQPADTFSPHASCHTLCGASSVKTTSMRVTFPQIAADKCLKCEATSRTCNEIDNATNSYLLFAHLNEHHDLCCAELRCTPRVTSSSPYVVGQAVLYYSDNRRTWYEATVTKVDAEGVEVNLKPGEPIPMAALAHKLKPRSTVAQKPQVDVCSSCPKDAAGCYASRFAQLIQKTCMDTKDYVIDEATCTKQWGGKWCGLPRGS